MKDDDKNKKRNQLIAASFVLLMLLSVVYIGMSASNSTPELPTTPVDDNNSIISGVGEKLSEDGWVLYTLTGCSACDTQREIMGGEYYFVTKIELGIAELNKAFEEEFFEGLPTWYNTITQEKIAGVQYPEQLNEMAEVNNTEVLET